MYLYYRAKSLLLLSHVPILQSKSLLLLSHVPILQSQVTLASITCTYTYTSSYASREHVHGPVHDAPVPSFEHFINAAAAAEEKVEGQNLLPLRSYMYLHLQKKCSHTYLSSVNCCPRDHTYTCIHTHARTHTRTSHKHMPLVIMLTIRIHPHTSKQAIMQDCCHSLGNPRLQS